MSKTLLGGSMMTKICISQWPLKVRAVSGKELRYLIVMGDEQIDSC